MNKFLSRWFMAPLLLALVLPARADLVATAAATDQPVAPKVGPPDEFQPKFLFFGFLLNVVLKFAMASFKEWRHQQLTSEFIDPGHYKKLLLNSTLSSLVSSVGGMLLPLPSFSFKSVDGPGEAAALPVKQAAEAENRPANFQGAHVAVVGFDAAGAVTGLRPLDDVFRTGERVKLKVLSTFDAWVVVENINPTGARQQVFPRDPNQAILLRAGTEILVPLVENQYFEFAGEAGSEQLVLTFRDPRAVEGADSKAEVIRQEERDGLGLLQEVKPGTFPAMVQPLSIRHGL